VPAARRWDLGVPGARVLIPVAVVAALIAAGFLWLSRPRPEPVSAAPVRPSYAAGPSAPVAAPAASAPVVDVAGKVRRPGVVTLSPGARVIDAIEAAGGLRPGARAGAVNLARHVVDGEQILVGATTAPGAIASGAAPGATASGPAPGALLDLNTATVDQFDQLPGVGPVLARRIVDYRTQHGAFHAIEELQDVTGIGERKYAELKDLVRV
jgi:competence protein ComEA